MNAIGLLASFFGALLVGISTQAGQVTGFVGGIVWAQLWWRLANAVGWLLMVVGFGLQFVGVYRTRRLPPSSVSPHRGDSRVETVPQEQVVPAQALEFEALLNVLERRGLIPRGEVLEEIRRLREKAAMAKD